MRSKDVEKALTTLGKMSYKRSRIRASARGKGRVRERNV